MTAAPADVRRLHIGGRQRREGWEILDAIPGSGVNHLGDAADLGRFADGTFGELYASHVLEHFDFKGQVARVLTEWHRVLKPGGTLYVSVPDMERLCHLYLTPQLVPDARLKIMYMIFGAHYDEHDYHRVAFDQHYLGSCLHTAGFREIRRVDAFHLFEDTSNMQFMGFPISINMTAVR